MILEVQLNSTLLAKNAQLYQAYGNLTATLQFLSQGKVRDCKANTKRLQIITNDVLANSYSGAHRVLRNFRKWNYVDNSFSGVSGRKNLFRSTDMKVWGGLFSLSEFFV